MVDMTKEEQLLLIEEATKFMDEQKSCFNSTLPWVRFCFKMLILDYKDYNFENKTVIFDRPLLTDLKDKKLSKKILINNEYGLLGNLLYKYRNDLDDDILEELKLKDIELFYFLRYLRK